MHSPRRTTWCCHSIGARARILKRKFMAIIKKNDVTPERPVIIVLYGTPGSGKTSVATTADNPLLIDTDRGFDRAVQRVDTLEAHKWQDIDAEREAMKGYKTIIVDTAKACLDDYLSVYAVEQNYKLKTNSLKRFGQMADDFKSFVNFLRSNGSDIIFICHDKETQEGDVIKHSPDCTGQSKDLLLRIADQVGYISKVNGQRTITFEPMDNFVGKNVAGLGAQAIPDATDAKFTSFMAGIITDVKTAIQSKSEAQRKANELLAELREATDAAAREEDAEAICKAAGQLPRLLQKPFFNELKAKLSKKGFTYDNDSKKFLLQQQGDAA